MHRPHFVHPSIHPSLSPRCRYFGCIPRSGLAGSSGSPVFIFWPWVLEIGPSVSLGIWQMDCSEPGCPGSPGRSVSRPRGGGQCGSDGDLTVAWTPSSTQSCLRVPLDLSVLLSVEGRTPESQQLMFTESFVPAWPRDRRAGARTSASQSRAGGDWMGGTGRCEAHGPCQCGSPCSCCRWGLPGRAPGMDRAPARPPLLPTALSVPLSVLL